MILSDGFGNSSPKRKALFTELWSRDEGPGVRTRETAGPAMSELKHKKILVVDDQKSMRGLVRFALLQMGIETIDGAEVATANSHSPAAAITMRMARNVSGPASCVPYLATTKPVLQNNTNTSGATRAKPPTREGRAAEATRPSSTGMPGTVRRHPR